MPANMEKKMDEEEFSKYADKPDYTVLEILKKPSFWFLILGVILGTAFCNGLSANLSLVAQGAVNIGTAGGALFYSLWQIASAAGGIIVGIMSDKWLGPVKSFMVLCIVCAAASVLLLAGGVSQYTLFLTVIAILGLGSGAILTLIPDTSLQIFGQRNFGFTYGILVFAGAGAALIGTQVTTRCAPNMTFTYGAALCAAGAVMFFIIAAMLRRENKKERAA